MVVKNQANIYNVYLHKMKETRIVKRSRHHNRRAKLKKSEIKPITIVDRNEIDVKIIDLVLKTLYHNSHIDTLHIERDIYHKAKLKIPYIEAERLWEVMLNTGLVNPVAGFGNAGKLKLSRTGYQLMAQYGGYTEYIKTVRKPSPPEEINKENSAEELTDEEEVAPDSESDSNDNEK